MACQTLIPSENMQGPLKILSWLTSRRTTTLFSYNHIHPNETLIYHGYIGCSPHYPSVGFSIRTLSAFRQIHQTCPQFSIQAQCKTLCHLHNVTFRPYLTTQFSIAFDVYLKIMHQVDERCRQVPMTGQHIPADYHHTVSDSEQH
ncbi:hypothetical protein EV363DRAFT_929973 [Boletus edulis]|nr:hypothetical protein EV363DRAFT_929973 [Boletus edulis]